MIAATHDTLKGGQTGIVIIPADAVFLHAWDSWQGGEIAPLASGPLDVASR